MPPIALEKHQHVTQVEEMTILTLDAPVLVRISKEHDQLVRRKSSEIGDREDFRKAIPEGFGLYRSSFPKNRIQGLGDVFVHILRSYQDVSSVGLVNI